jgi:hypothetical protein
MAKSGDRCECESCHGRYVVYASFTHGDQHVQYLHCNTCKAKPAKNKVVRLAESVHRRSKVS